MATATDVQRLRSETGAGVMDSKKALEAAKGDFEKAKAILKEKGLASAAKRGDREAKEGVVEGSSRTTRSRRCSTSMATRRPRRRRRCSCTSRTSRISRRRSAIS